jgi:predicted transcriptional regulator
MKKKGRPPVTREVPEEAIILAYRHERSVRKVAAALGISTFTVRKYLKNSGEPLRPAHKSRFSGCAPLSHRGALARWIRENPGKTLPTSPSAIAAITGSSLPAVKSYLYRRRKSLRSFVHSLPDLRKIDFLLKTGSETVRSSEIASYSVLLEPKLLRLVVKGKLRSSRPFKFSISNPDLFQRFLSLPVWEERRRSQGKLCSSPRPPEPSPPEASAPSDDFPAQMESLRTRSMGGSSRGGPSPTADGSE